MQRLCQFLKFRTIVSAISLIAAATFLLPGNATAQQPEQEDALGACVAITRPDDPGVDRSSLDPRLRDPGNRIEGADLSGQDFTGKDFRGKVLVDVKLKGAKLRGADFTEAIICHSDLTDTDLSGVRLDRAFIGGGTEMRNANLTNASARGLRIADAPASIRIDGADLRGARLMCDDDFVRCIGSGVEIVSMFRADLRGAVVAHLCCTPAGLRDARLDGVTTHLNGFRDMDFETLAAGVGESGHITLMPNYGFSGRRTKFSGRELRQLAGAFGKMRSASIRPSFDCARAASAVEKAICADPQLAALDRALNWLWQRVEHSPEENAAQKAWLGTRADCPPPGEAARRSFASSADPEGCIGLAYAQRIKQLAPKSSRVAIGSGTYTTDEPLELPRGNHSALAEKFLIARGFRVDEITVKDLGAGAGKITGEGLWANGHMCGFEAPEPETKRVGSLFRITDDPKSPSNDNYSISFIITPQVAIMAGGNMQFQCGARGMWSAVYFRQPDNLVSKLNREESPH